MAVVFKEKQEACSGFEAFSITTFREDELT